MLLIILLISIFLFVNNNYVMINPVFTTTAYQPHGFYDYYRNQCDKRCLTVRMTDNIDYLHVQYASNLGMRMMLKAVGVTELTDIDLNNGYDLQNKTLIVLHSEYVTEKEYQVITNHNKVIYLYPNALYAKVNYNGTYIQLLSGHGYNNKSNAFDWQYDNTEFEQINCTDNNFKTTKIPNGIRLDCWLFYPSIIGLP